MTPATARRPRGQVATGLLLAAAVIAGWAAIHVGGIFLWHWSITGMLLAVPLVLIQTWLSTGLFIIAHDCMHGSLVPGRPGMNRLIGTVCLAAYAALSYQALHPKHHAHHAAPGTASDPDFHVGQPRRLLPWFARFFAGYYTHMQIVRIALVAGLYVLMGAPVINIVLFWAVPAVLALGQLFVFGTYLPHRHGPGGFADHHNARSTRLSPVASLVSCFHFGGYHHEHHLSPDTPWWRLPAVRANPA